MFRLRDVSLRTKLYALLIGYTLTIVVGLVLAGGLLERYRVGGTAYQEVAGRKDLQNERSPPPLLIGRAYLMLHEAETANTDDDRRKAEALYYDYVAKYNEKRDQWL